MNIPFDRIRAWGLWLTRAAVCLGLLGSTGCAGYMAHRARDAADIFTLTMGICDGAKVRLGPAHVGAIRSSDLIGLRGGQLFANGNDILYNDERLSPFPLPRSQDWNSARKEQDREARELAKKEGREWKPYKHGYWEPNLFGSEIFRQDLDSACARRGKNVMVNAPGPFWVAGKPASYFTQIEVSAGVLLGVRVGFNPGEVLDFLVGWFGLDLYKDDVD
jgi:hypothetical protein